MCLAGVLDDLDPGLAATRRAPHVRDLAVEVDGHEQRVRGPVASAAAGVEAVVALADVHRTGRAAGLRDRLERRHEVSAGTITSSPGSSPGASSAEAQRIEAAGDTDALPRPAIRGERVLEGGDLRAVDELAALDQLGELVQDRVAQLRVARPEVEKRHALRGRRAIGGRDFSRHRFSVTTAPSGVDRPNVAGCLRPQSRP